MKAAARSAPVFAALGDETRLAIVERLARGGALSIQTLTGGTGVTRQAVTKHLRVLEGVGLVRSDRAGREVRWALEARPLDSLRAYLDRVSARWDDALERLRDFVEK